MHLWGNSHHPGNVMEPFRFIIPFLLSMVEPRATRGPAQLGSPGLPHLGDGCVLGIWNIFQAQVSGIPKPPETLHSSESVG